MNAHFIAILVAIVAFFGTVMVYDKFTGKSALQSSSHSLEETIRAIKLELVKLKQSPGQSSGLELDEVKIVLLVEKGESGTEEGSLKVPVFEKSALSGKSTLSQKSASKITVKLKPPEDSQTLSTGIEGKLNLANILLSTRKALNQAMDDEPRLAAKSLEIEVNFVFVQTRESGAAIEAHVFSAGASLEQQMTDSNTISLSFVNPAFAEETATPGKAVPP